jgi:hypothetical protein
LTATTRKGHLGIYDVRSKTPGEQQWLMTAIFLSVHKIIKGLAVYDMFEGFGQILGKELPLFHI